MRRTITLSGFIRGISKEGEELIKKFEGFSAKPYKDQRGRWTQGYGNTLGITQFSPKCSEIQAEVWLKNHIVDLEKSLYKCLLIEVTQAEFDALCSFAYNVGVLKFKNSTLLDKLNKGDRQGAGKEFLKWCYFRDPETNEAKVSEGLMARRQKEMELFLRDMSAQKKLAKL